MARGWCIEYNQCEPHCFSFLKNPIPFFLPVSFTELSIVPLTPLAFPGFYPMSPPFSLSISSKLPAFSLPLITCLLPFSPLNPSHLLSLPSHLLQRSAGHPASDPIPTLITSYPPFCWKPIIHFSRPITIIIIIAFDLFVAAKIQFSSRVFFNLSNLADISSHTSERGTRDPQIKHGHSSPAKANSRIAEVI